MRLLFKANLSAADIVDTIQIQGLLVENAFAAFGQQYEAIPVQQIRPLVEQSVRVLLASLKTR